MTTNAIAISIDVCVTIGGARVALWRVRVLGFIAGFLGVPITVDTYRESSSTAIAVNTSRA